MGGSQPTKQGEQEQAKSRSLWSRSNKFLLAAGATAGAITAILTLLARFGVEVPKEEPSPGLDRSDPERPLVVDVIAEPGTVLQSSAYDPWPLIPHTGPSPSDVPPAVLSAQDHSALFQWAATHGAIDAHHTMFKIVLRSMSEDAVLITGMRVRVHRRAEPVAGWYVPGGICGAVPVRSADVNLDATPPEVLYYGVNSDPSDSITLELRKGKPPEVIEVLATTEQHAVSWDAEIIYQVAGEGEQAIRVDDGGDPFHVTAVTPSSQAYVRTFSADGTASLERQPAADGKTGVC